MKKFKEFLIFLISFILLGGLMILTFFSQANSTDVTGIMSGTNYLKLILGDPTFIFALINSYLPIVAVSIILCTIYKIIVYIAKDKLNITRKLNYIILFSISFITPVIYILALTKFFDFTNNLIFSLQVSTIVTFVFWLIELAHEKVKWRKRK